MVRVFVFIFGYGDVLVVVRPKHAQPPTDPSAIVCVSVCGYVLCMCMYMCVYDEFMYM